MEDQLDMGAAYVGLRNLCSHPPGGFTSFSHERYKLQTEPPVGRDLTAVVTFFFP